MLSEEESADRTEVRPAYPRTPRVLKSRASVRPRRPYSSMPSHPKYVSDDAPVRAAYPRTPSVPRRFSTPIKGMRGFPKNLPISSLFSYVLPRFPCPFKPEALVIFLKSRGSILLPRFPRIPRKIRLPRRNSAQFSISLSSNFQVSSYPFNQPLK